MSIPRLELVEALVGLRLTKQVCMALEVPMNGVTYWVDSLNVGFWIRGQSRNYKPFVSNRVGEIQEGSNPDQWGYVPTRQIPADKATRGLTVHELVADDCWWQGPDHELLNKPEEDWPKRKFGNPQEACEEIKAEQRDRIGKPAIPVMKSYFVEEQTEPELAAEDPGIWRLGPTRYSKWYRVNPHHRPEIGLSLVRVRSWVQRLIDSARKPKEQRNLGS